MTNLNKMPGLTPQRLSELYRGVIVATGDASARADLTYMADGGIRLKLFWTQANVQQRFEDLITADQVAASNKDGDALFVDFSTNVLEEVRAISLAIEKDPATPAAERKFGQRVRDAAGSFMSMLAGRRAAAAPEADANAANEEAAHLSDTEAQYRDDKLKGQVAMALAGSRRLEVWQLVDGATAAWQRTGNTVLLADIPGLGIYPNVMHFVEFVDAEGRALRAHYMAPRDSQLTNGQLGYADPPPSPAAPAIAKESGS